MNNYFDEFRNAGTTGKDIIMKNGAEIFSNWIIQYYKEKGVEFFITNEYVIFPIEHFLDYFDVTAKYRIKRSGSSSVGKSLVTYFAELLSNNNTHNYCITNVRIDGTKLFVKSNRELHNKRFICGEYEYMFSQRNSEYELRKLSNTYNANVIFSIKRKNNDTGLDDEAFEYLLK